MKTDVAIKRSLLSVMLVFGALAAYAQHVVTGTVSDESGPVVGATVVLKDAGSSVGTATDVQGRYSLSVPDSGSVIEYSFLGYDTVAETVGTRSVIDVVLSADSQIMDEVVVVGFGTQKRINLTGAVSEVKMDEVLGDRPISSVSAALQGAIPGLNATGGLGPDGNMSLNIRGFTSTTNGSPLILIDNVQASLDMINPQDIESVSVLKDAAASSIYGARASFGVILITTKKSARNEPVRINYNNNFGFASPTRLPELAGNIDYLNTWMDHSGSANFGTQNQDVGRWIDYIGMYNEDPSNPLFADMYKSGAWKDPMSTDRKPVYFYLKPVVQPSSFYQTGFSQSHNISVAGGGENINYRVSGGFFDNKGIITGDRQNYRRYNISSYVNGNVTKWLTQSLDIKFGSSTLVSPTNGGLNFRRLYGTASNINPTGLIPTVDARGNVTLLPNAENPLSRLSTSTPSVNKKLYPRIFSSTRLTPFEGFEANFEYTFNYTGTDNTGYEKPTLYGRTQGASTMLEPLESSYTQRLGHTFYNAINAYSSYSFDIAGQHNFKVLGGYNQEWQNNNSTDMTAWGLVNPDKPSFSTATGVAPDGTPHPPVVTDSFGAYSVIGVFMRLNYDYMGRYLVELNGRYDGSSKFPVANRFGFFPSVSIGWNITNEPFMKSSERSVSLLKLRASYGSIGNQNIGNYGYFSTVNMDQGYNSRVNWYDVNSQKYPNTIRDSPNLIRSDYSWEVVTTLDVGLDFAFLRNRLFGSADWYDRTTTGMLSPGLQLPGVVGTGSPMQNSATVKTRGWEFSIGWRDRIRDVRYDISFNIFDSKALITKYNNPTKIFGNNFNNYYEGMEIGEIWGYETDGYYTADDFIDPANPATGLKPGVVSFKGNRNISPGDIKYRPLDNASRNPNYVDGEISSGDGSALNPGDRRIIGYDRDRYVFGLQGGASWKGINFSFRLQGVAKHDVWLPNVFPFGAGSAGLRTDQLNYWRPIDMAAGNYGAVDPGAEFPRLYGGGNAMNYEVQTAYLASAAYIRVKNITLGYDLPSRILDPLKIKSLKIFVSFENPFTIDSLPKGYDPENISLGSMYQVFKTSSVGLNLTF